MLRLIRHRILIAVPLALGVAFAIFVLVELSPTDPAERIAGEFASAEVLAEIRGRLDLDRPLPSRYASWVANAARGDLGTSLLSNEPVVTRLRRAAPASLSLLLLAMVISTSAGALLGVLAATRRDSALDRLLTGLTALAIATPSFWLALLLILAFAVGLPWLPAVGFKPIGDGLLAWVRHMALPSLALSALFAAEIARQLRTSLLDAMDSQYVLAARARGVPRNMIMRKHALKNAAAPVVTITGYRLAHLIGGTVVVERAFAIRGLGSLSVEAAFQGDLPVILGVVTLTLMGVLALNMLVDISYGYFNPRIRA